ncbi:MAG: DUF924 domain-containing protein [Alcaligenaceae bacterium]|nr:DUF924 domain-containing protein [Alcaligenaceae bacterium]
MNEQMSAKDILAFWFDEVEPAMWWKVDPDFDDLIRGRFLSLMRQAAQGELYSWRDGPRGRLAEIIVLDQFSRNVYRNTPQAFAQDSMALALAQEAVAAGAHHALTQTERGFLFLPYMHSESAAIHQVAEPLYREYGAPENYDFELRHKAIIDRFGRYPHRNETLGRMSTPEETEFLMQPGSSF